MHLLMIAFTYTNHIKYRVYNKCLPATQILFIILHYILFRLSLSSVQASQEMWKQHDIQFSV